MSNPEHATLAEYHESVADAVLRNAQEQVSLPGTTDEQARHMQPSVASISQFSLAGENMAKSETVGTSAQVPTLPTDPQARKALPICTGVLDYFPLAIAAVAACSKAGNDQHNPGEKLHWAREKSTDHADCIVRHLMERGKVDSDGILHSAKACWRCLALLQTELEGK